MIPVQPGKAVLLYPQWIPGDHAPTNELKRLAGLRIEAAGKRLDWTRNPDDFYSMTVDVPAGVTHLDIEFQNLLPLETTGSDAFLGRKLLDVQWQGALLYPAGYFMSRIDVDASLKLPRPGNTAARCARRRRWGGDVHFERVSLETLVDSPVFAGKHFKRVELDAVAPARSLSTSWPTTTPISRSRTPRSRRTASSCARPTACSAPATSPTTTCCWPSARRTTSSAWNTISPARTAPSRATSRTGTRTRSSAT